MQVFAVIRNVEDTSYHKTTRGGDSIDEQRATVSLEFVDGLASGAMSLHIVGEHAFKVGDEVAVTVVAAPTGDS